MVSVLYSVVIRCATLGTIMNQAEKKPRLSREAWLQQALDILAEDPEHLRIDELAERLGVSKGSFYWHFENRSEFILAMAEFWRDSNTLAVIEAVDAAHQSAEDRLYALMKQLLESDAARYDLAVRAWARHEPNILPVIREVDSLRTKMVRSIFDDMGFDGPEAQMRTRLFVLCHSFDDALTVQLSRTKALEQLDARHAFFTHR